MPMRIEKPPTPARRASPRKSLVRVGVLEIGKQSFNCVIVDLSRTGAKVRTLRELRAKPTQATLHLKGIGQYAADIAWMRGNEIGLNFHAEADVPEGHDNSTINEFLEILPAKRGKS
jgi:hypothetical protein